MDSKAICEILKASKGTGVKEIKLKELCIKFDNLTKQDSSINNSITTVLNDSVDKSVENISLLEDKQDQKAQDEIHDEFVMANLMATDPEAFERQQRNV